MLHRKIRRSLIMSNKIKPIQNRLMKIKKIKRTIARLSKCKKCNGKIIVKEGFWWWDYSHEQKGGFYHTECGMINNPAHKGSFPF